MFMRTVDVIAETFVSWSLHQRDAPIAARERLAASVPRAIERGALGLVTCHRVEVFACLATDVEPRAWLSRLTEAGGLRDAVVVRTNAAAVLHLFRVAAGLDSAIAGERQILGQLRRAYAGRAGPLPSRLSAAVERALHHGRLLRAQTALGSVTRSIGSLAVDELLRHIPEPAGATVLVVGAGEIGKLAIRALRRRVGHILVVSQSGASAERAASVAGGEAVALAEIASAIDSADGVISAADTRGTVLGAELLATRVARRPLVVVDIAMPRSVAEDARRIDGLLYRSVDDLGSEATVSTEIIAACEDASRVAAARFIDESAARDAAPVIAALHARADGLRRRQLERALAKLGHLSQRDREVVAGLAQALARGLLHEPTAALRAKPSRAGAACDLFGIEP
jgi:glutamyl-tRNA reductase